MQSWTPSSYIRAIGAWPQPSLSTWPKRRLNKSHSIRICPKTYATSTTSRDKRRGRRFAIKINDSSIRDSKSYQETDLPLPPFLRESNHANRVEALKVRGRDKHRTPPDIYVGHNQRTQVENERNAPFSTAFAQNPYAQALADPIREDRFSNARLPISCLLDFHMVEKEAELEKDGTAKAGSSKQESVDLMPLSLVAELVPKNKNPDKVADDEKLAVAAWDSERTSWAPQGSASYILGKRDAIDWVSEKPQARVRRNVLSRRVNSSSADIRFKWRGDMSDFVLQALRRIVVKKLGWFLRNKQTADKPGSIATMPGSSGLERLDAVENVMCVLRLRPKGWSPNAQARALEAIKAEKESLGDPVEQHEENSSGALEPDHHKQPSDLGSARLLTSPSLAEAASNEAADPDTGPQSTDGIPLAFPNAAQAHRHRDLRPERSNPFLANIRSQPPSPSLPSTTYYPTVPYLNRRVPGYNLPYLLGAEAVEKLLAETVFDNCEYAVVTRQFSTVGLQRYLLKLASYVHKSKSDEVMI